MTYKTYRGDSGGRGEQKIIWEGGSIMQPWGDIRKILVFCLILQKKISKIRVAFYTKFLYGRVVGNETGFPTVCPIYRAKLFFIEF